MAAGEQIVPPIDVDMSQAECFSVGKKWGWYGTWGTVEYEIGTTGFKVKCEMILKLLWCDKRGG